MVTDSFAKLASLVAVLILALVVVGNSSFSGTMACGLIWPPDLDHPLTVNTSCLTPDCKGWARDGQLTTWPDCPCNKCKRPFLCAESIATIRRFQSQMIAHHGGILSEKFAKSRLQGAALRSLMAPTDIPPGSSQNRPSSRGPSKSQQQQQQTQQPVLSPWTPVTQTQLLQAAQSRSRPIAPQTRSSSRPASVEPQATAPSKEQEKINSLEALLTEFEEDGDETSAAAIRSKIAKLRISAPARTQGILEESNAIHVEVQRKLRE